MYKEYDGPVESSIEIQLEELTGLIKGDYYISKRSVAILLLQDDTEIRSIVERNNPDMNPILEKLEILKKGFSRPVSYELAVERQSEIKDLLGGVVSYADQKTGFAERLSIVLMNPYLGIPILFAVIYWGIYKLVGSFGAGVVVDYLESTLFGEYISPFVEGVVNKYVKYGIIRDLLVGRYGVFDVAIKYSLALVLPIVSIFFFVFSIIEDSGYLPRIAMLIDRLFKKIGLSGRAVIPMALGFGCDTVATIATRTLPTVKEKVISTLLLALAVPCSAQLGVIMALLGGHRKAFIIWFVFLLFVFILVGYLASIIIKGERPSFYMEIPPLRLPNLKNVAYKTYVRVKWYMKEVVPVFIFASVILWVLDLFGIFDFVVSLFEKPVMLAGLPKEASKVFVFGFFRRDYGAVGLYELSAAGALNIVQLTVACAALTLFIPCVAQFLMMVKERGIRSGIFIFMFVLLFSFSAAYLMNKLILYFNIL